MGGGAVSCLHNNDVKLSLILDSITQEDEFLEAFKAINSANHELGLKVGLTSGPEDNECDFGMKRSLASQNDSRYPATYSGEN